MAENNQTLQLLQASVDEEDESHFRILCDGKDVRYVTIAAGLYAAEDMCFAPTLFSLLPPFPPGDWNVARIDRHPEDDTPYFAHINKAELRGVKNVWHSTHVDHLNLTYAKKLRSGVYEATAAAFTDTIIVKFARFDWEIDALDKECEVYQWIENQGIGPGFLGHLLEEDRVIGFIMENIADARHAGPSDLVTCQAKLDKLHQLGILHGDVNRFNILIRDEDAVLLDFECAKKCNNPHEFERELGSLAGALIDTSGLGGSVEVSG